MTREEKIKEVNHMCDLSLGCYACNFYRICANIRDLDEIPDTILDAMIENGNKPDKEVLSYEGLGQRRNESSLQ